MQPSFTAFGRYSTLITITEQVLLIEEESLLIGYKNKWKQTTDNITHIAE